MIVCRYFRETDVMRAERGFTLIEVLIALLVLSVGLLGLASLQISSVANNQEASLQSQATAIMMDLASRMRANREYINWDMRADLNSGGTDPTVDDNIYGGAGGNITLYHTDATGAVIGDPNVSSDPDTVCGAVPASFPGVAGLPASVTTGQICTATSCSAKQMAAFDRWEVCRSAVRLLPQGEVRVTCQDTNAFEGGTINKLNPYFGLDSHPVFSVAGTQYLNGADGDDCSPNSVYTIAVYWSSTSRRRDVGEGVAMEGGNARCQVVNDSAGNPKACVLMDILP